MVKWKQENVAGHIQKNKKRKRVNEMLKRILCLLFVVLMIPFALFSCTKDKGKEDDSASDGSVATADLENDHLEARDYDGKVFRILSRESTAYEFMGDSTGSNLYQKVKEKIGRAHV